jgi:hypothetical protein
LLLDVEQTICTLTTNQVLLLSGELDLSRKLVWFDSSLVFDRLRAGAKTASSARCWMASRTGVCSALSISGVGATHWTCTPTSARPIALISWSLRSADSIAPRMVSAPRPTASTGGTPVK